jgi:branched-chain amino acid transport system permease protein
VLLMILIGGLGTLSGAVIGAAVFRLLEFYLDRWFGASAGIILGLVFIAIVLYLPYGIVGTWRIKASARSAGWQRLKGLAGIGRST